MSVAPPGANGTIMRIGRVGYSCAATVSVASMKEMVTSIRMIFFPSREMALWSQ
jgi:hypothetical protein